MRNSQLLQIQDAWCREMAQEASNKLEEIETQLMLARGKRMDHQPPEAVSVLDKEIATLQRIREELESDIENWMEAASSESKNGSVGATSL